MAYLYYAGGVYRNVCDYYWQVTQISRLTQDPYLPAVFPISRDFGFRPTKTERGVTLTLLAVGQGHRPLASVLQIEA